MLGEDTIDPNETLSVIMEGTQIAFYSLHLNNKETLAHCILFDNKITITDESIKDLL